MSRAGAPRATDALLFDLDGTLVDSAQGLADTANDMRTRRGLPPLHYAALRPGAGSGARGMLAVAFDSTPCQPGYDALREEFLDHYPVRMLERACLFDGVSSVLDTLDNAGVPWGIVTNKAMRFAEPMAQALGLLPRAGVLVGGDSTPHTKPHPAPLLEAARRLAVPASRCVYLGDDQRDIEAGRAAAMGTLAAGWGYLGHGAAPHTWGADALLPQPLSLLQWLELA
ncbi:MAG: HAD-IA family hydrolase [Rhizobacter sp.]|nr:HAD-IA family hydrolase [Rhizobacter sp.]